MSAGPSAYVTETSASSSDRRSSAPKSPAAGGAVHSRLQKRSEEHTSEPQSLMRNSYAGFCLEKKKQSLQVSLPSSAKRTSTGSHIIKPVTPPLLSTAPIRTTLDHQVSIIVT